MPCAKVLPLHYSNIKSTRVAVFAIFLRRIPSKEFVHSQTKCEARHKTSSGEEAPAPWAHMLPTRSQRLRHPVNRNRRPGTGTGVEIIRCILITIQINDDSCLYSERRLLFATTFSTCMVTLQSGSQRGLRLGLVAIIQSPLLIHY